MKQALLAVSYGTAVPQARTSIEAVERALREELPARDFFRAFTGTAIRQRLDRLGERVPSPEEMLAQLREMGYTDVLVQPTHLLYGSEYDALRETVSGFSGSFARLSLGRPLLAESEDLHMLASALMDAHRTEDALVLVGHGTGYPAGMVYPALQTAFRLQGCENAYVGTIKGWPDMADVSRQLRRDGQRKVLLAPLMLSAGGHALRDITGDGEGSWKCRLESEGFAVRCHTEGLGMLGKVQEMYAKHLRQLEQETGKREELDHA